MCAAMAAAPRRRAPWPRMRIGVPTEIKTDEHRVAITPAGARELVDHGNEVIVEQGAGAKAPHVIREQLGLMKRNAVLVDVSIDQGGCLETSRPTTHRDPTCDVDRVTHYCVANMPGAVPITSTAALTNATIPYIVRLATEGVHRALNADPASWQDSRPSAARPPTSRSPQTRP
jgi:alanine dehydrogenase